MQIGLALERLTQPDVVDKALGVRMARLLFESATVSGVRVPKFVLQQIVSYYSKSETYPSGINLDDPFRLPARIREIQVERGRAIVIQ